MNTNAIRHLYIHIPFCHRRCSYCDFNTYANMDYRMEAYVDALVTELHMLAETYASNPQSSVLSPQPSVLTRSSLRPTVFLGGGTPSMLPLPLMERVLAAAGRIVPLAGAEVTVEANPGTVLGGDYLSGLRGMGVNRLSMGVQTLHDPTLRVLGRIHTADEARTSFDDARRAGFDNVNVDFIFGLPGQTVEQWRESLDVIATWGADHLSLYSLILEPDTPLFAQVTAGRVSVPDDDDAGAMYEAAIELLPSAGYVQYEISNWAKAQNVKLKIENVEMVAAPLPTMGVLAPTHNTPSAPFSIFNFQFSIPEGACHHNLAYWLNADYLAAGAGAHGHVYPRRYADVLGIDDYIRAVDDGKLPVREETPLSEADLRAETMFMGLRLNAGVSNAHFRDRCGLSLDQAYGDVLGQLAAQGLLERDEGGVRLTDRGRMLGNQVFARFV
ncbi:MAG: radical SAM family heme chaperone HemW [Chloroflexales bacterium]|nr:radical SAM family heme chaperone HemW [Chloroflexales bacterium]